MTPHKTAALIRRAAKQGCGVAELCQLAGLNKSSVYRWNAGTMVPTRGNFDLLLQAVELVEEEAKGVRGG